MLRLRTLPAAGTDHRLDRRLLGAAGAIAALAALAALSLAGTAAHAAFPGLNGRIACDGERGPAPPTPAPTNFSRSEIYSMRPDGSDLRLLTNTVGERDSFPAWSPDGERIVFDRRPVGVGTRSDLFTMDADGTDQEQLTFAAADDERSAWSPDGETIAFQGGRDGNFNIFRIDADTPGEGTRLTTHVAGDFSPAWSPDGETIAFDANSRDVPANSEIYSMDATLGEAGPGGVTKLTNTDPPIRNWSASWSPDGKRIVFQSTRDGVGATRGADNFEIYTMDPDGTDVTRLTFNSDIVPATTTINEAADEDPVYSPDGKRIVFQSARSGDVEVYTMNAVDGSGLQRLTNSPGFDGHCDWQPVQAAAIRAPGPAPAYPGPAAPFADCPTLTANVIRGTAANNVITGTARGDRIFAGTGNDIVDALAGDDCVDLGPGTDRGEGGAGRDLILGGLGVDRLTGSGDNDRLRGGAAADRLSGGSGNDNLHGQSGSDRVSGGSGRDRVNGGSSSDRIAGGGAGDRLAGDQGNDRVRGGSGNDSIRGNSGNDRLSGGRGRDRLSGGSGNDRISARDGKRDRIRCGRGRDSVSADRVDRVARDCERRRR